jgi:hypothetical protein
MAQISKRTQLMTHTHTLLMSIGGLEQQLELVLSFFFFFFFFFFFSFSFSSSSPLYAHIGSYIYSHALAFDKVELFVYIS